MNVLAITEWYPSPHYPSKGIFIRRQIDALGSIHDTKIVVIHVTNEEPVAKFEIHESQKGNIVNIQVQYPSATYIWNKYYNYKKAMRMALERAKLHMPLPDIVWVSEAWRAGIAGMQVMQRRKIPMVISEHWTGYSPEYSAYFRFPFFVKKLILKIFKSSSRIIVVSNKLGIDLQNITGIDNWEVIPNVVHLPTNRLDKPTKSSDLFRWIHVSTLDEQKNIPLLLDSFQKFQSEVPNSELLIIGGEPEQIRLYKSEVEELNIPNITFLGSQNEETVLDKLSESNALIMTSRHESFSVVIAESWSLGIPVVSTMVGGLTDQIPQSHGIGVQEGNADEVSQAMIQLYNYYDSYEPDTIAESYRHYTPEIIGKQLHATMQKLIKN